MKSISNLACVLFFTIISSGLAADVYNKMPTSLVELVNSSDLIVIGTYGGVFDKRLFYGYQENADQLEQLEQETPFTLGLPLIDYAIEIEEINKNDEKFQIDDSSSSVIYRTFEDDDEASSEFSVEDRKGRTIFFLSRNPDNETYGITSFMHRIKLGNTIKYSFDKQYFSIPFAESENSAQFVEEVRQHVKF